MDFYLLFRQEHRREKMRKYHPKALSFITTEKGRKKKGQRENETLNLLTVAGGGCEQHSKQRQQCRSHLFTRTRLISETG